MDWSEFAASLSLQHLGDRDRDIFCGDVAGIETLVAAQPSVENGSCRWVIVVFRFGHGVCYERLRKHLVNDPGLRAIQRDMTSGCEVRRRAIDEDNHSLSLGLWLSGRFRLPSRDHDIQGLHDLIVTFARTVASQVPHRDPQCWSCAGSDAVFQNWRGEFVRLCSTCREEMASEAPLDEVGFQFSTADVDADEFQRLSHDLRHGRLNRLCALFWLLLGHCAIVMIALSWFLRFEVFLSLRLLREWLQGTPARPAGNQTVRAGRDECPQLFTWLDPVADICRVARPSSIFLSAGGDVVAFEHAIGLGVPLFEVMLEDELKSLVAREFYLLRHRNPLHGWIASALQRWSRVSQLLACVDGGNTWSARCACAYAVRLILHHRALSQKRDLAADGFAASVTSPWCVGLALVKLVTMVEPLTEEFASRVHHAARTSSPFPLRTAPLDNELLSAEKVRNRLEHAMTKPARWLDDHASLAERLQNLGVPADALTHELPVPPSSGSASRSLVDSFDSLRTRAFEAAEPTLRAIYGRLKRYHMNRRNRLSVLTDRLATSPTCVASLLEMASIEEEPEQAMRWFEAALEADPRHVTGWLDFARYCIRQGDWGRAIRACDALRGLNSAIYSSSVTALSAVAFARAGQSDAARQQMQAAVADPHVPAAVRAQIRRDMANAEQATKATVTAPV